MVTPEILAYVRAQQAAGFDRNAIASALAASGWAKPQIDEVLDVAGIQAPPTPTQPTPPSPATPVQPQATQVAAASTSAQPSPQPQPAKPSTLAGFDSRPSGFSSARSPVSHDEPHIPATPTLRALTAIDSQIRAGVSKDTIRSLLAGVGWSDQAISEAIVAVEWGESLRNPDAARIFGSETRAPDLSTIKETLDKSAFGPDRTSLAAIDALMKDHVRKEDIRVLLEGVGWQPHAIDEAFLAVEWRQDTPPVTIKPEPVHSEPKPEIRPEPPRPQPVHPEPIQIKRPTTDPYAASPSIPHAAPTPSGMMSPGTPIHTPPPSVQVVRPVAPIARPTPVSPSAKPKHPLAWLMWLIITVIVVMLIGVAYYFLIIR